MSAVLKQLPHADRKRYLGGSAAPIVMRVSPWATEADLYYRIIGEEVNVKVDPAREKIFKRGKRLEPVVIEMAVDELGLDITKVSPPEKPNRYQDPEHDFLAAEIDFEWRVRPEDVARWPFLADLVGTIQNGEVKTVSPFQTKEWGEMDTDEVPIHYAFQSMHGLGLTSRSVCLYLTLFGADNLVTYFVQRDEETITAMRARLVKFWRENVLLKVVPAPQTIEDLQRMYLRAELPRTTATPELVEFVTQLHHTKDQLEAFEARKEELEFQIKEAMGAAEALVDGRGQPIATWKNSQHSGLNQTALKEQRPEIHAEFYESRPMRRFYLTGRRNRK